MKKILFASIFLMILLSFAAWAQEETADPGITPDSALWGLDVTFEKLSFALTTGDKDKALKGLEIAQERLAEIKAMIEANNIEASQKSKKAHGEILLKVEQEVEELDEDNSVEELEAELEIEQEIEDHKQQILELEGQLTPEQQAALDAFLLSLGDNVKKVEIKIKTKQGETKIKIKAEFSDGEDKIEKLEGDKWQRKALKEQEKATEEIAKAESKIARFEQRRKEKFELSDDDEEELEDETDDENETEEQEVEETEEEETSSGSGGSGSSEEESSEESSGNSGSNSSNGGSDDSITGGDIAETEIEVEVEQDAEELEQEFEEDDEDRLEDELDTEGNILDEFNLTMPQYEERSVATAKKYVEEAKAALSASQEKFSAGEFKASYAYARFAKKLAQRALEGDNLVVTEEEKDLIEDLKDGSDSETPMTEPETTTTTGAVKEFSMVAKQWSWEPSAITVQQGDTVKISINNMDVPHGFSIDALGVDEYLPPGETTIVEFVASTKGTFEFDCSVSCGSGHGDMEGSLIVE